MMAIESIQRPDWDQIVGAVRATDAMRMARVSRMLELGAMPAIDDRLAKDVVAFLALAGYHEALWRMRTVHCDELAVRVENRRIADLEELIAHCCVHAGEANCGYEQMRVDQQQLYDEIVKR